MTRMDEYVVGNEGFGVVARATRTCAETVRHP